jgi:hypothetical protein
VQVTPPRAAAALLLLLLPYADAAALDSLFTTTSITITTTTMTLFAALHVRRRQGLEHVRPLFPPSEGWGGFCRACLTPRRFVGKMFCHACWTQYRFDA